MYEALCQVLPASRGHHVHEEKKPQTRLLLYLKLIHSLMMYALDRRTQFDIFFLNPTVVQFAQCIIVACRPLSAPDAPLSR